MTWGPGAGPCMGEIRRRDRVVYIRDKNLHIPCMWQHLDFMGRIFRPFFCLCKIKFVYL